MCGADISITTSYRIVYGSPPRVRSRHFGYLHSTTSFGITSACAEQTICVYRLSMSVVDHLRVCGADIGRSAMARTWWGSPPRVRSRRGEGHSGQVAVGITSACAEQTSCCRVVVVLRGDHLRVCGADIADDMDENGLGGSPPRVRSRRARSACGSCRSGITSACAEQTGLCRG